VIRAWNRFFLQPEAPTSIALFRILYGALIVADLILLRPDWLIWLGPRGLVGLETARQMEPGTRLNLFALLPASNAWVNAFFWFFVLWAVLLTLGVMTRASSIIVFLCLASMQQRDLYIVSSGDTLLRVAGFFLMFAPAGAALSVDRLWRIWQGRETAEVRPRPPWAQRMIQIELALVYFATFCLKMQGSTWRDGTALYYVYHLDQFRHFPVPSWVLKPALVRVQTWLTLAVEFSLGTLVWVRRLRYPILLLGIGLHLSIEYSMNIPLFEWTMLAMYAPFIYPGDLTRTRKWLAARASRFLPEPVTVVYDGGADRPRRAANLLRAVDVFERLTFVDLQSGAALAKVSRKEARGRLLVLTPAGPREGFAGVRFMAPSIPILWPVAAMAFYQHDRGGRVRRDSRLARGADVHR